MSAIASDVAIEINPYESPALDDSADDPPVVAPRVAVRTEPDYDHFVWVGLALAVIANGLVLFTSAMPANANPLPVLSVLIGIIAGVPMNVGGICTAAPGQRWVGVVGIALSLTPWPLYLFMERW